MRQFQRSDADAACYVDSRSLAHGAAIDVRVCL
jgi:hypothetical protein